MKLATIILTTVIALSTNVQANPIVEAECSAIFKAMSISLEKNSPELSARARHVSARLKSRSDLAIGSSTATKYYVLKMDEMAADLRVNGGTGVRENEMKYCVGLARSYSLM